MTVQLSWWQGWILLYKSRHLVLKLDTNLIFWLKLYENKLFKIISFSMNFIIFKNNFISMTCSIMLQFLSIINLPCYEGLILFPRSNRCLTTGEQFFNYSCCIAWLEHITFWSDDNVSSIQEHYTVLHFYYAVSLQNTPQIDMLLHSDTEPISLYSHSFMVHAQRSSSKYQINSLPLNRQEIKLTIYHTPDKHIS